MKKPKGPLPYAGFADPTKPLGARLTPTRHEKGEAVSFPTLVADKAAESAPARPRRPRYIEPSRGLEPGVEVALTLTTGKMHRGWLVAMTEDAVAMRARNAIVGHAYWTPWRQVRSLRAGTDGPRQRSRPLQAESIVDLVRSRGGQMRAAEATATLNNLFGWEKNSLTPARRRSGVLAEYRHADGQWWWVLPDTVSQPPQEDDDDD